MAQAQTWAEAGGPNDSTASLEPADVHSAIGPNRKTDARLRQPAVSHCKPRRLQGQPRPIPDIQLAGGRPETDTVVFHIFVALPDRFRRDHCEEKPARPGFDLPKRADSS